MIITGRPPNDAEWNTLSPDFPLLNRANVRITGGQSTVYNCIAWSLGLANQWINPPQPQAAFNALYTTNEHRITTTGSAAAAIDGWTSTNSLDFARQPEAAAIAELGSPALPLLLETMATGHG